MPTNAEYAAEIQKQFPNLATLYQGVPDVWNILIWAVATGMGPEQVQAAIQNTNYYRTQTDAQKKWDATAALDPTEAAHLHQTATEEAWNLNLSLGAGLTWDQTVQLGKEAAINAYSLDEMKSHVVAYAKWVAYGGGRPGQTVAPGEFTAAMTKVKSIADEYGMPVDPQSSVDLAAEMLSGGSSNTQASEATIRERFKQQAKSLYPTLGAQLDAGVTVKQIAQPFITLAAQETEVSPDAITFNDPKWRAMLEGSTDPKTGQKTPMTLSEWQAKLRQDSVYGFDKTTGAKQQASAMETELLKRFGSI